MFIEFKFGLKEHPVLKAMNIVVTPVLQKQEFLFECEEMSTMAQLDIHYNGDCRLVMAPQSYRTHLQGCPTWHVCA